MSFTITVSNTGAGAAYDVNVSDALPTATGVTWTGVTTSGVFPTATLSSNSVTDDLGTLNAGDSVTFVVSGHDDGRHEAAVLDNTATATTTNNSAASVDATATTTAGTGSGTGDHQNGQRHDQLDRHGVVHDHGEQHGRGDGVLHGVSVNDPLPDSADLDVDDDHAWGDGQRRHPDRDSIGTLTSGGSVTIVA